MSDTKRQKVVSAPVRKGIFSPLRSLGDVSSHIPFSLGTLGNTFYVVTAVAQNVSLFDANNLHLMFHFRVPQLVTATTAKNEYVYVAYGSTVGVFKRGKLAHRIAVETEDAIIKLLTFGDFLIAATESQIFLFKKPTGGKVATEPYTTLAVNALNGAIVDIVHPPTYLNKIVVATASNLLVFNLKTAKLLFTSPDFVEPISALTAAPVLDIVAVGHTTGGVTIYNIKKAKQLKRVVCGETRVSSVSFRSDGSPHFVASLMSGDLFFYDLNKRARIHVLRTAHKEAYGGVARAEFLNGQPIVVTNGNDNQLKEFVFDPSLSTSNTAIVSPPRFLRGRGGHSAPPSQIVFQNENAHQLLSASRDLSFWSFSLRKDAQSFEMSQKRKMTYADGVSGKFPEISAIAITYAPTEFADVVTAHKDTAYAVTWHSKLKKIGQHTLRTVDQGVVKAVAITQCGNFALVGSAGGSIACYNLQSGILRKRYNLHKKAVTGLAVDGMNRKMVSVGLDGVVGFYDFTQSTYLGKLVLDAPITQMVYHRSSDLFALALDDLSIVVVDAVTQKVVRVLYGHSNRITSLDFSPDGRWLVSASLDATIRTWDLPTGNTIDGIRVSNVATSVKFAPTGDVLVSTHVKGNGVAVWTNRAQFRPVSTRQIEEDEFSSVDLAKELSLGEVGVLDGAFDEVSADFGGIYTSVDQINEDLLTLSVGPRSKFNTLVHLDTIKLRNKVKEAPKKSKNAPFFLALSGETVGDRASVAEGVAPVVDASITSGDGESSLSSLRAGANVSFESRFTQLLREAAEKEDYVEFLAYLLALSPSSIDLEIRSLSSVPPLNEMANFVDALTTGLGSNKNFELYEAFMNMLLKVHSDVVHDLGKNDEGLQTALVRWNAVTSGRGQTLEGLVKYCAAVVNFVGTV
ncbi:hypothetical protein BABINDRAFT_159415 [Babjeviella inositovora NRRL Y-12698]|uniref:Uncharacterized protein n=1 Tax=Babjeviella inositovora NRRL Y-12698 TaxID=984486 RepID=A0A1E3QZ37_9ASCO|nr:uncharacterized protein BABINDRAFT_159415 [Babjeviella inositovora NRRL Y-12698]ODQ82930.1 hypothetical protein BABINDRAFT_159415 [Babjeviella inositovora NRRL Y-12698]